MAMPKTQSIFYLPHGWMRGRMEDGREGWMEKTTDEKDDHPRTKPPILYIEM